MSILSDNINGQVHNGVSMSIPIEDTCINFRAMSIKIKYNWYHFSPLKWDIAVWALAGPEKPEQLIEFCVNNCEHPWSRDYGNFYFKSKEDIVKVMLAW